MRRAGFTMVELLVALAVGALVVLAAAGTVGGVMDSLALADDRIRVQAERANGFRWMKEMLANVEVDATDGLIFEGHPDRLDFHSWLWTPEGWTERSRVSLRVDDDWLVARVGGEELALLEGVYAFECEYLVGHGEGGVWLPEWRVAIAPPAALRVRIFYLDPETPPESLILIVGERG